MSGFLRLLLATVMAVLGWLALPAIAVSASASTHVETYIYDAPAYDGPGSDAASERGPPTEVRYTTHDAVVRWSHGASVRPHDASRLTFTSDAYLSKLVQAGEPTTTTGRQVVTLDGDLLASGRSVSAAKPAVGFAEGLGHTALTPGPLQHGTKNLTKAGVLPAWSGKTSPGVIERAFTPILEHPTATFNHTLGGTRVRGFLGDANGQQVAAFVYKEGPYQGQLASSFVPSANQLKMWGVP